MTVGALVCAGACGGNGVQGPGGSGGTSVDVMLGGRAWHLGQGEILSEIPLTNGQRAWQVVLTSRDHDRCSLTLSDASTTSDDVAFVMATVPAAVGRYDIATLGVSLRAGFTLDVVAEGSLEVIAIEPRLVTIRIDGKRTISGERLAATFQIDGCGFSGQDLFTLQRCDLPVTPDALQVGRRLQAVSPGGRVVVPMTADTLGVYARRDAGGGACRYELDATYGDGGQLRLPKPYRQAAFDAAERLYVTGDLAFQGPQQPGSLYRITPGMPVVSCRYNQTANAGVTDGAPDDLLVLPDGSAVYLVWRGAEKRLDLASPSVGAADLPCDFIARDPGLALYTDALSADADGLTFVRELGERTRAAVTDFDLVPVRYFGGTPSGLGEQGLTDVTLLARCPAGFCAASARVLKAFGAEGQFRQMIQLQSELSEVATAMHLAHGKSGEGYLRVALGTNYPPVDTVYKLTPR
jgi:hypothetical protein